VAKTDFEQSIRERAYEYIQQKIVNGEFPAGSPVSDLAIAREFGASRTPIREAISQLATEGFLEQIPNRGAVVVQITRSDITDLFELREALEVYSIRKAAAKGLREAEARRLTEIVEMPLTLISELKSSGLPALDSAQMQRFMAADLSFHTLLLHAAGNPRMLKVVNDTRLLIRIFTFRHAGHTKYELEEIHRQHTVILDAVTRGSVDEAVIALTDHIRQSMRERLDAFDDWRREKSLQRSSYTAGIEV
jgi:DNA-binding GntR family transcriptional regulator